MSLTYDSFYYPFGRNSALMNFKPMINDLKNKYFEKIYEQTKVSCVFDKSKDIYRFYFRIPSEKNNKYLVPVFFDVLLEFLPKDKESVKETNLKNYNINIFSNSPNFMFTFTYVLNKQKSLPKCLPNSKYSKLALHKAPDIKNTQQLMTIEKTTFFALFHLDYHGYLTKELIPRIISDKNDSHFINIIDPQERKLNEIRDQDKLLSEEKKLSKNKTDRAKIREEQAADLIRKQSKPRYMEDSISYNMRVTNLNAKNLTADSKKKVNILKDRVLKVNKKFNSLPIDKKKKK